MRTWVGGNRLLAMDARLVKKPKKFSIECTFHFVLAGLEKKSSAHSPSNEQSNERAIRDNVRAHTHISLNGSDSFNASEPNPIFSLFPHRNLNTLHPIQQSILVVCVDLHVLRLKSDFCSYYNCLLLRFVPLLSLFWDLFLFFSLSLPLPLLPSGPHFLSPLPMQRLFFAEALSDIKIHFSARAE